MTGVVSNVAWIVSQPQARQLALEEETLSRVNPKFTMVARAFVRLLGSAEVARRLETARTPDDLKALLVVDDYLARVRDPVLKRQIVELLADPAADVGVIATLAALSYARDAYFEDGAEDARADAEHVLYPVEAAAAQLGREPEALYRAIAAGEVEAVLCLTRAEIERLAGQEK